MAKKSFKNNPALQFISSAQPVNPAAGPAPAPSPAQPDEPPPADARINPLYLEKRTRRLQLVLQPSLYERVKAKASAEGLSVNELIHRVLEREV